MAKEKEGKKTRNQRFQEKVQRLVGTGMPRKQAERQVRNSLAN